MTNSIREIRAILESMPVVESPIIAPEDWAWLEASPAPVPSDVECFSFMSDEELERENRFLCSISERWRAQDARARR